MRTSTEVLIGVMRVLAREIKSGDGVANAAIAEAADRLQELHKLQESMRWRPIDEAGDGMYLLACHTPINGSQLAVGCAIVRTGNREWISAEGSELFPVLFLEIPLIQEANDVAILSPKI